MLAGPIFALDVATNMGVAVGSPGSSPRVFSVRLKKPGEGREIAGANLVAFLQAEWTAEKPGMVFKEAPPALAGFALMANSEDTIRFTYGLHFAVETMAARFGLRCEERPVATIRKHYLGRARKGDRAETKRAVIQRGILLGHLPKDCVDDNCGDAAAAWDYAAAHFARTPPRELHMFNEEAAA